MYTILVFEFDKSDDELNALKETISEEYRKWQSDRSNLDIESIFFNESIEEVEFSLSEFPLKPNLTEEEKETAVCLVTHCLLYENDWTQVSFMVLDEEYKVVKAQNV